MKKRWILIFALLIALIPNTAGAKEEEMEKILKHPTVSLNQMRSWASEKRRSANPEFINQARTFYDNSVRVGVNPAVTYAQSAKETNFFKFTGVLTIDFKNPCGMKISAGGGDKDPNAHQRFESWDQGIQAQVDHLALYAGHPDYPKAVTPDPRHFGWIKGKAKYVEELGGNWAPSPTYGEEIVDLMNEMKKFPMAEYERISGKNRFETAEKINKTLNKSSKTAVLASGISYPDALTANTLTKHVKGTLYLQPGKGISQEFQKVLDNKQVDTVYIVGGEVAISEEVEKDIKRRGIIVKRISGRNRYKTSEEIARFLGYTDIAILSSGESFADTLSISPVAVKNKYPIYLTAKNYIDEGVLNSLSKHKKIIIVGGEGVVSSSIEQQIRQKGIVVERITGVDRYETSLRIAEKFYPTAHGQIVASGENFPDSLAAVSLADSISGGVLLSNGKTIGNMADYIRKSKPSKIYSIGGTAALSSNLDIELQKIANEK